MDLGSSQISDVDVDGSRGPRIDCSGLVGFGLISPRQVGLFMFIELHGPGVVVLALLRRSLICHAG